MNTSESQRRSMPTGTPDSARMTLAEISAACSNGLPLPPSDAQGSPFAEPWQAQAFAMTVLLHQRGVFTWPEWAAALTAQIRAAQADGDADDGSTYYQHWLDALEQMIIQRGLGTPEQIHELEHAWEDAAERTPHGQPIALTGEQVEQVMRS